MYHIVRSETELLSVLASLPQSPYAGRDNTRRFGEELIAIECQTLNFGDEIVLPRGVNITLLGNGVEIQNTAFKTAGVWGGLLLYGDVHERKRSAHRCSVSREEQDYGYALRQHRGACDSVWGGQCHCSKHSCQQESNRRQPL